MEDLKNRIKLLSKKYFSEVKDIRRYLHMHPELSFNEFKTSEYISKKLKEYNIPFKNKIAQTGIVATINCKNPTKKVVALRADMDALPLEEKNKTTYCSKNHKVMHACGHDAHMSILLGVAKILNEMKDELEGTVKLIFQPAEEKLPGGATAMIKGGVLKNPDVNVILGQHVIPTIDAGKIGIRSGYVMASCDEIFITVKGKGGHAATPDLIHNPIPVAAQIISECMKIPQMYKKNIPTTLSFGKFIADGRTNIVPDEVKIEGTFRAFDEIWRKKCLLKIENTVRSVAKKRNMNCDVKILNGYPFLVNNNEVTERVRLKAIDYLGKSNIQEIDMRLTAEDFAYYSQIVPACFYRLGIKKPSLKQVSNLHTATFDIDEKSLETGVGLMTWLTVNELFNNQK